MNGTIKDNEKNIRKATGRDTNLIDQTIIDLLPFKHHPCEIKPMPQKELCKM